MNTLNRMMNDNYFVTSNEIENAFVGIKFVNDMPMVIFPQGFNIADDEKEQRKDVFKLLNVLKKFAEKRKGDKAITSAEKLFELPVLSYQYVIQDFLAHGYYVEKERVYKQVVKGKINWKRTIQKEKPQVDNDNIVYLNFQVRQNKINDNNLLTQIHKYCVYLCFQKFGWLYLSSAYLPQKPLFKLSNNLCINILKSAINSTFNDAKKKLFQSMINILLFEKENGGTNDFAVGVEKFEYVWERLIDYVYGENIKDKYLPHARWTILNNGICESCSALEPDTIMKHNNKYYVLDAKYYKYGITNNIQHLPQTSSIQKQITYGKHILENEPISKNDVYNAFLLPYNGGDSENYKAIGIGTVDWEQYNSETPNCAYVLGVLVDTKTLITSYKKHNQREIEKLAKLIDSSVLAFRDSV